MNDSVTFTYIMTVLFYTLILGLLLVNSRKVSGLRHTIRIYTHLIACNMFSFLLDMIYMMCSKNILKIDNRMFYLIMVAYFVNTGILGILWAWYATEEQNSPFFRKWRNVILFFIPITVFTIMTASSYWTHLIFYIDSDGNYQRGSLFLLQYLIPFGYMLLTSIRALIRAFDKKNFLYRGKYLILVIFIIPPMIGGIVQLYFQELPLLGMGTTYMALVLYVQQQNEYVSIDPLTKINNRFQIMQYLTNKILDYNGKKDLYLFMIDVDKFKSINDTFGHVEGDAALIKVADTLKKVGSESDCFVGRYGGDEFMIIVELKNESPRTIYNKIHFEIEQINHKKDRNYKLSLSIGFAKYTKSYRDIVPFIAAADEELYKVKKNKKYLRIV